MIARLRQFCRDRRGAAAVDFALSAPIMIILIIGVMQLGIAFLANSGIRNAVEVGARYAIIYPYPTDDAIITKIKANAFGVDSTQLPNPTISRGTSNGRSYIDVTATYPLKFNFIFITTPAFNISYTRRAYPM